MYMVSLKAARVNAGYSQEEASAKLNISRLTLGRYERSPKEIPIEMFTKMCDEYGVPRNIVKV